MNKIFVTGMSGTGKSSIAAQLSKRGFLVYDIDHVPNLCSWVDVETGVKVETLSIGNVNDAFMEKHDYVCDVDMLAKMLGDAPNPTFVFGAVGDNHDVLPLFDKVFLLECTPVTMIERLQSRNTNDFGKDASIHNRLIEWHRVFNDLMRKAGAISINVEQPLNDVVEELLGHIHR